MFKLVEVVVTFCVRVTFPCRPTSLRRLSASESVAEIRNDDARHQFNRLASFHPTPTGSHDNSIAIVRPLLPPNGKANVLDLLVR